MYHYRTGKVIVDPVYPEGGVRVVGDSTSNPTIPAIIYQTLPDYVNSGILVYIFPAHAFEANLRAPTPLLVDLEKTEISPSTRDVFRPQDDAPGAIGIGESGPGGSNRSAGAGFLSFRSSSPKPVELYLVNITRTEELFDPISPYAATSNCNVPSETIESTRTTFLSAPSYYEKVTFGYGDAITNEYLLFGYMNTSELTPRTFYTVCSEGYGAFQLFRVWITDLFATQSHLTPFPTTSLVTQ